MDILNDMGGKADVAAISSKERLEVDDIVAILETGQILGFIEVKSEDILITEKGYSLTSIVVKKHREVKKKVSHAFC